MIPTPTRAGACCTIYGAPPPSPSSSSHERERCDSCEEEEGVALSGSGRGARFLPCLEPCGGFSPGGYPSPRLPRFGAGCAVAGDSRSWGKPSRRRKAMRPSRRCPPLTTIPRRTLARGRRRYCGSAPSSSAPPCSTSTRTPYACCSLPRSHPLSPSDAVLFALIRVG